MSALREALQQAVQNRDLTAEQTQAAVAEVMDGGAAPELIAALLTALRMKGESVDEIAGAARAMHDRSTKIPCRTPVLLDTCGTGGDELHTFNISTAAAIVVAGAGVPVAKHGNRSVSSSSGSADVLEALGVRIDLSPRQVAACVDEVGLGFCFAPLCHGAMKHAAPVRKRLGFRTIFNLLGPLTNPAGAGFQLVGASTTATAAKLAHALARLGRQRAVVVCGNDELDEVSLWGPTAAFEVAAGEESVREHAWTAETFGLAECRVDQIRVDSAEESARVVRSVLAGDEGPARDIVLANVAAALWTAERADSLRDAATSAAECVDSGAAQGVLERLVAVTNG